MQSLLLKTNLEADLIKNVFEELFSRGVQDIVLAPGGRNAAIVAALESYRVFHLHYWSEERSAAFFALGKSRASGLPVAILTTSGTAVGELMPAAMEAYYSATPLIMITADRPRRFRGTGAPQAAEQKGIFGCYAPSSFDLASGEEVDLESWDQNAPLHINLCLEEPKKPFFISDPFVQRKTVPRRGCSNISQEDLHFFEQFLKSSQFPIVLVGGLAEREKQGVLNFLKKLKAPVWLEGHSGLREHSDLRFFQIEKEKDIIKTALACGYPIDAAFRIGSIPTLRLWRDLETSDIPLLSLSSLPYPGSTRGRLIYTDIQAFLEKATLPSTSYSYEKWMETERKYAFHLKKLLISEPESEPGQVFRLSCQIGKQAGVFIGNSSPIRNWDLFSTKEIPHPNISASRGLNGIDGQVSTFLGHVEEGRENWAMIGDLTMLYDLAGFWGYRDLKNASLRMVVINNGGGKIFKNIFNHESFENRHKLSFSSLADFWGLDYACFHEPFDNRGFARHALIEVVPKEDATERFWNKFEALCGKL